MKKLALFFVLTGMVFISCNRDEDPTPADNCQYALCVYNVDGGSSQATGEFNNTLLHEDQGSQMSRRLDIRFNINGGTFFLSLGNWDIQNPPQSAILTGIYDCNSYSSANDCVYDNGDNYCKEAMATYTLNGETFVTEDDSLPGTIEITKIDGATKKVSGNFNVRMHDFSGNGEVIKVQGTFSDLCYREM